MYLFIMNPGQSLGQAGDAYKNLADIKYALEDAVHQNFLDPLQQLQNKELKEVNVSSCFIINSISYSEI